MSLQPRGLCVVGVWILSACVTACTSPTSATVASVPASVHGAPTRLELTASPGIGTTAGRATITLRVLDAFAVPVQAVSVTLETSAGSVAPSPVVTDEQGQGTAVLSAPAGSVQVTATIANGPTIATLVAIQAPPPAAPTSPPSIPAPTPEPVLFVTPAPASGLTTFLLSTPIAVTSVSWSFGDGATDTTGSVTASHSYQAPGSYAVRATAQDVTGRVMAASATALIAPFTIPAPAPVTAFKVVLGGTPAAHGSPTSLQVLALTEGRDITSQITAVSWIFGDGGSAATTTPTTTHTYAQAGKYEITAAVTVNGVAVTERMTLQIPQ